MSGIACLGTGGSSYFRTVIVAERLTLGKSTKLTNSGSGTACGYPLVLTDLGGNLESHIAGNVGNLNRIDLGTVLYLGINDRCALANIEYVLNANDKIKGSVLSAICNKSVAEEELAILISCLYGNRIADCGHCNLSVADVTSSACVFINVDSGRASCSAFTLVVVVNDIA